jgi:hypothetical protein
MSVHDIRTRPNLQPLFGPLEARENDALLDRLLTIDARLTKLAVDATNHVRVPYKHTGLSLFVRNVDAEISGGPTGSAGDLWFEVGFSIDANTRQLVAPPWTVDSRIVVFCLDAPEGRGEANTHDLVSYGQVAHSPMTTLEALEMQIEMVNQEIYKRDASIFTRTPHAQLP